jgi:hypothetical protein
MSSKKALTPSQAERAFTENQDRQSACEWLSAEFEHRFGERVSELPLALEDLCKGTVDEIVAFAQFLQLKRVGVARVPEHQTLQ